MVTPDRKLRCLNTPQITMPPAQNSHSNQPRRHSGLKVPLNVKTERESSILNQPAHEKHPYKPFGMPKRHETIKSFQ